MVRVSRLCTGARSTKINSLPFAHSHPSRWSRGAAHYTAQYFNFRVVVVVIGGDRLKSAAVIAIAPRVRPNDLYADDRNSIRCDDAAE